MSWAGFLKRFLLTLGLTLGLGLGLIVLMNPFGNLPVRALGAHVIMDTNDRYQFPAIVRSGAFDSGVFGTSSSKLLDPAWLEQAFGGRFANLAFNDGRAWEEYQLTLLFLRTVPRPGTLLFGIDWVWCAADADVSRFTRRGFPPWIYDDAPWNDWLYILNWRNVDTAARQLANRAGLLPARFPANGFDMFVPPDSAYDAAKARQYVWRGRASPIVPLNPAYVATDAGPRALAVSGAGVARRACRQGPRRHASYFCVHAGACGGPAAARLGGGRTRGRVQGAHGRDRHPPRRAFRRLQDRLADHHRGCQLLGHPALSPADRAAHRRGHRQGRGNGQGRSRRRLALSGRAGGALGIPAKATS